MRSYYRNCPLSTKRVFQLLNKNRLIIVIKTVNIRVISIYKTDDLVLLDSA